MENDTKTVIDTAKSNEMIVKFAKIKYLDPEELHSTADVAELYNVNKEEAFNIVKNNREDFKEAKVFEEWELADVIDEEIDEPFCILSRYDVFKLSFYINNDVARIIRRHLLNVESRLFRQAWKAEEFREYRNELLEGVSA